MPGVSGAHYNTISSRMWGGESFSQLSPLACSGQALWLFLLTCPERNEIGLWRMGLGQITDYTNWPLERLRESFGELLGESLIEYDERAKVILIVKALKEAQCQNPNVAKSWGRALASMPSSPLKDKRYQQIKEFLESFRESFVESFMEGFGESNQVKSCPNQSSPIPSKQASNPKEQEPPAPVENSPEEGVELSQESSVKTGSKDQKTQKQKREPWDPPESAEGFRTPADLAGKTKARSESPPRDVLTFLAERFPEVAPAGRKRLAKTLSLQDCYEADALRGKLAKPPDDPGAYWYRVLESRAQRQAAHG